MKYFLILFLAVTVLTAEGQVANQENSKNNNVYTIVDKMPQFPGGNEAMVNFVKQNVKPVCPGGKIYVSFVVDASGIVKDAKVLKGVSPTCDEEALRVVNHFPTWIPGEQAGQKVNVQYVLPINF